MTQPSTFDQKIYSAFIAILILQAMSAYVIFGIPIPWLAQSATLALAAFLFYKGRLSLVPGTALLAVFIGYAVCDTLVHSFAADYAAILPAKSTTSYLFFVGLRFFGLLTFASMMALGYWAFLCGFRDRFLRDLSLLGSVVAIAAIYIYIAQLKGWWEPPRNRMGTSGGGQNVVFSYAFHRAMGTFREPSHLAEWLVFPLFASLAADNKWSWLHRCLIMSALLLTGSLTGYAAVIGGVVFALVLHGNLRRIGWRGFARITGPLAFGVVAFSILAASRSNAEFSLYKVMWGRVQPFFEHGFQSTDRDYIYSYLAKQNLSATGHGLGNSNLEFAKELHLDVPASFLSIFVNYLLSLGFVGLTLFCLFLLYPFRVRIQNKNFVPTAETFFLISAYVAWLFVYFVHTEEPGLQFAILFALLIYDFRGIRVEAAAELRTA